jgi:hypothetical protein
VSGCKKLIKHGYNQLVKGDFEAKIRLQIDKLEDFPDKGKFMQ